MSYTSNTATVLIVDDTKLSRKKLEHAVSALGLKSVVCEGGKEGLDKMRADEVDLVLLDILMPEIDGFEVLRQVQADTLLREIPVLVISSLDQTPDIVQALELGAVDFLPKDVEPEIFKARVEACLEKKRLRDQELSYLADVGLLTRAALHVKAGFNNTEELQIGSVTRRNDGLGALATVFKDLAETVRARELAARARINLLQGCLLLILMGATWGVVPTLSKILVAPGTLDPLGLAAWVALATLIWVSGILVFTGRRPRLNWRTLRFGLITGVFAGVGPQVALFWVSQKAPGTVISITLAMESLIVFAIAAVLGMEKPSLRRLTGLMLGLFAVLAIMLSSNESGMSFWMLGAMIVPACYAVESIIVAALPDEGAGPFELLWLIMFGSTIWGWSAALATGSVIQPTQMTRETMILIVSIGLLSTISNSSYVLTIRKMGAVFASQYAYVVTIMGVGWAVLLLDERLTLWIWIALASVMLGMFMVRPKEDVTQVVTTVNSGKGNEEVNYYDSPSRPKQKTSATVAAN